MFTSVSPTNTPEARPVRLQSCKNKNYRHIFARNIKICAADSFSTLHPYPENYCVYSQTVWSYGKCAHKSEHANLQVTDELLGGGEGGELSGRAHADPRYCSTGAPPQSQNAMLPVDGNQGVGHPLLGRGAA